MRTPRVVVLGHGRPGMGWWTSCEEPEQAMSPNSRASPDRRG
ncbi:hypothetical protein L083_3918 [Actinoplanes sp. N902-109]|nr:hypothetical protein L083_3918 [Actinoplanes sp. N902-109]